MIDRLRRLRAPVLALVAAFLLAAPARADDDPTDERLRAKLAEVKGPLGIHWDEGIYFVDAPKRFTMRLNLRLDTDYYGIEDGAYVSEGGRVGNTPSDLGFRRARFTLQGVLGRHHFWKVSLEATSNTGALRDSFVDGDLLKAWFGRGAPRMRLGNFFEPYSLEQNTPSGRLTFMERAGPSQALGLGRSLGIMAYDTLRGGRMGYAGGVFVSPQTEFGGFVDGLQDDSLGRDGVGFTGRLWWMPVRDCRCKCHRLMVGVAASQRVAMSGVTFRSRPESYEFDYVVDTDFTTDAAGTPLLDDAGTATVGGVEVSYVRGRWFAQAETYTSHVRSAAGGDPFFWGGYVMAGCWLTGECRRLEDGIVQPNRICRPRDPCREDGGMGGVEVAARFSTVDLTNAKVVGGTMNVWSLELNWHLKAQRRFMFNLLRADADDGVADAPIYVFQTRFQIVF